MESGVGQMVHHRSIRTGRKENQISAKVALIWTPRTLANGSAAHVTEPLISFAKQMLNQDQRQQHALVILFSLLSLKAISITDILAKFSSFVCSLFQGL
jgi:hypothetical protein